MNGPARHYMLSGVCLMGLAVIQPLAELAGATRLKVLAAATNSAPAMKVFTAQQGFETFAAHYRLRWWTQTGEHGQAELTPENYRRLSGPYNRRNAYGAALSYGPVLRRSPLTQPMAESIAAYAFCTPGHLLEELGLAVGALERVEVEIEPRGAAPSVDYELVWELRCDR